MRFIFWIILLVLSVGCDSSPMAERDDSNGFGRNLSTFSMGTLQNRVFTVRASGSGYMSNLALKKGPNDFLSVGGVSPIWLATNQNGPRAVFPMFRRFPLAKQEYSNDSTGYFILTADSLSKPISNWPTSLGAPSLPDGSPLMMGDQMAWSAFRQAESNQFPIDGLRLGMTVFIYNDGPESHYAFHRYDIVNTGETLINDLHIGYGADVDLTYDWDITKSECAGLDYWKNQTGFDEHFRFNYFYFSRHPEDGNLPDHCYGLTQGFAVMSLSSPDALDTEIVASRMWRRNVPNTIYPDYSENLLTTPESILWALQGKSYSGEPMINPITGQTTLFAFTGDPVQRTGWIDERNDVRGMVSFKPISLAPGEKTSFVVAHFWSEAASLAEGIAELKYKFGYVFYRPQLWDY